MSEPSVFHHTFGAFRAGEHVVSQQKQTIHIINGLAYENSNIFLPYSAQSNEKNSGECIGISGKLVTDFEINDISPIVNPILNGLVETNEKLQETLNETKKLAIALKDSSNLTSEQNENLLKAINSVEKAAAAISQTLEDKEALLDDIQNRLEEVVNHAGIHGLWENIKFWLIKVGIVALFALLIIIAYGGRVGASGGEWGRVGSDQIKWPTMRNIMLRKRIF